MRALHALSALLVVTMIASLVVLATFSTPSSDDYCFAAAARIDGFWTSQIVWFNTWTGRYSSTFMVSLIGLLPAGAYALFALAILGVSAAGTVVLIRAIGGGTSSLKSAVAYGAMFALLYSVNLPSVLEAYFWASGGLTYQLANGVAMLLLAQLIMLGRWADAGGFASRRQRAVRWVACAMVAFFLAGCNEILMLIVDMALMAGLVYTYRYNRPMLPGIAMVTFFAVAGSLLVLLAPGNEVRLQLFAGNRDYLSALSMSASQAARMGFTWLSQPGFWLFAWLSLEWIEKSAPAWARLLAGDWRTKWMVMVALFALILFCLFPSYWSTGQAPPPRARTLPLLLFCWFWPIVFWLCLRSQISEVRLTPVARPILGLILVVTLVWSISAQQWFRDLGVGYRYWREVQSQDNAISIAIASNQRDLILPEIKNRPKSLTTPELMLTGDKTNYANRCFARYYRLDSVEFRNSGAPAR